MKLNNMEFKDFKSLTEEEKQFWQFEQLACVGSIKNDLAKIERRINFVYAWATGVAAGVSFVFMFIKAKFFDR